MRVSCDTRHRVATVLTAIALAVVLARPGLGQPTTHATPVAPKVGQDGKDVMWVPTSAALVEKMLDMAKVTADDLVMDLGSGDGRTVIAAARRGAHAVGVEFNPDLVTVSRQLAEEAGVGARATFVQGDMYTADVSKATVLALFLLPPNLERLRDRFLTLAPGSRIVINTFAIPGWEPDAQETLRSCPVYCTSLLYVVPARVHGRWTTSRGELVLEQTYQVVRGTLADRGKTTPVNGRLRGAVLELVAGNEVLRGTAEGDRIDGPLAGVRVPTP